MLIAPDGTAKLTDFGVSVIMTNNADTIEAAGPNDTCAVSLASCPFVMASLVLAPPCKLIIVPANLKHARRTDCWRCRATGC